MTCRLNPKQGDKVSLLGYGMMRLPATTGKAMREKGDEIDQEMVNRLVDYAIEHGVNYFDTSPAYCQGLSEKSTGIALKRHKRNEFFIATKLSNFNEATWSREESIKMYKNSFKELQVDYIDYYLLHAIGMGGMANLEGRYINNGLLDFLVEERKAGRIRNLGFSYHGDIEVFDHLLSQHDQYQWDFVQIELNYLDWDFANEINSRNTDARYLYAELQRHPRRYHGAVTGRPSFQRASVHRHRNEDAQSGTLGCIMGFSLCRYARGCFDRPLRYDLHGASERQPDVLLPAQTA